MADSAVSFVLGRLGEFVVREAAVLREVGNDVMLLKDKLEWLHTFVEEADQKRRQGGNAYMDVWVQQTRQVALELEDVLDEFMHRVDLHQGLPLWKKWFKFLSACATQIAVRRDLSGRIAMIRARLDQISNHSNAYIKDYAPSATRPFASIYTSPTDWDEEVAMVVFEVERKVLEHQILSPDSRRSIISIVGESGIGKSTLAQQVYCSRVVMMHFDIRIWIKVPPSTGDADLLHIIFTKLGLEDCDIEASHRAHHKVLEENLRDKRYLVVLDGLVNFNNWNFVMYSLPDNGKGSRVMITTALTAEETAHADQMICPLQLGYLNRENSRRLFCGHVFGNRASMSKEHEQWMDKAYNCMYQVTNGLPLAIVLLGRLLRKKEFPNEWDDVLVKLKSIEGHSRRVEGILALSFDHLPNHLKSCLLYFAMMPEDLFISGRRLVRLWVAEGFLKPRNAETMEEVGQTYLKDLISRGMIQVKKVAGDNFVVAVHSRVHAMVRFEAQESKFLVVYDNTDIPSPTTVRHLFLRTCMHPHIHKSTSLPKLRSILCDFVKERLYDARFISKSKFLRVIDLRGLRIREVPYEIGSLIHLRYLGVRCSELIKLPPSIANLIHLQTLDIERTKVETVVQGFWQIPSLRHVVASTLRLPKNVGVLHNMHTITGLVCFHPWGNNASPLRGMINLRRLQISGLTRQHWTGLADAFNKLESIMFLHLAGNGIPSVLFTKFTLRRLQILELFGEVDMTNSTVEDQFTLPNLTRVVLKLSRVDQNFIDKIVELPSLTELVMSDESYAGEELFFPDNGFRNVTKFVMVNLPGLLEWKISPKSVPRIKTIALSGCPRMKIKLEGEGQEPGLMEELKEVAIWNMPEKISIEPDNSDFKEKICNVMVKTKSDDIRRAMQNTGRWRAGVIAI